jgi:RNA polymerase sigma factor (TIGR02999 family)
MTDEDAGGPQGPITLLLARWGRGDTRAFDDLLPLVYAELRRLAGQSMRRERPDHTLQPTALVHETYLRLIRGLPPSIENRRHFFALMARLMRRVLVDHARGALAERRGGGDVRPATLDETHRVSDGRLEDLLAIDEAIESLRELDERKARVIELRFFGGLEVSETAEVIGVSAPTVVNDTRMARAWLYDRLLGRKGS